MIFAVQDAGQNYQYAVEDFRFVAVVAQSGQLLRDSRYFGKSNWENVLQLVRSGKGKEPHGYREEFIRLSEMTRNLQE